MYTHLLSKLQTQITTLNFLKRDWTSSKLKQYFNKSLSSFTVNSIMYSVIFSSHERIDVLCFWFSDVTTTSENKSKKSKYLKELKIMILHQLSMYYSYLIQVFSFTLIMRSLNYWKQFKILWYKFTEIRIIASAANHKIYYYWRKWKTWSWWMTWISANLYW